MDRREYGAMELNPEREDDAHLPHDRHVRFYNVVTTGNLIMVLGAILPIVVWGIRLEGRVDTEALLRGQLEKQISRQQDETERRNARIEVILEKINSDVTALRIRLGANQKDVGP